MFVAFGLRFLSLFNSMDNGTEISIYHFESNLPLLLDISSSLQNVPISKVHFVSDLVSKGHKSSPFPPIPVNTVQEQKLKSIQVRSFNRPRLCRVRDEQWKKEQLPNVHSVTAGKSIDYSFLTQNTFKNSSLTVIKGVISHFEVVQEW